MQPDKVNIGEGLVAPRAGIWRQVLLAMRKPKSSRFELWLSCGHQVTVEGVFGFGDWHCRELYEERALCPVCGALSN